MAFKLTIQVEKAPWLDHPEDRWSAGLQGARLNFRTGLSRGYYPPLPPSGDHRTYLTADKADAEEVEHGRVLTFGSTFYLPFLLWGTRRMTGWPGKQDELTDLMQAGFRQGVIDFGG